MLGREAKRKKKEEMHSRVRNSYLGKLDVVHMEEQSHICAEESEPSSQALLAARNV